MKKRILSLALAIILVVTMAIPAMAAVKNPPKKNAELKEEITVSVPYFPGLEITMTNVPYLCVNDSFYDGMINQVKFYYGKNTTISFNRDITLKTSSVGNVKLKAGEAIKSSDLKNGSLGTTVIANANGSYRLTNSSNINIGAGQKSYNLSFVDVQWYSKNIDEGNAFTDIRNWNIDKDSSNKAPTKPASTTSTNNDKPFELDKLQSAVSSMEKGWTGSQKVWDMSYITAINNQLTYLNREIAAGKKPADAAAIKKSIKNIETFLEKTTKSPFQLQSNGKVSADTETLNKRLRTLSSNIDKVKTALG